LPAQASSTILLVAVFVTAVAPNALDCWNRGVSDFKESTATSCAADALASYTPAWRCSERSCAVVIAATAIAATALYSWDRGVSAGIAQSADCPVAFSHATHMSDEDE